MSVGALSADLMDLGRDVRRLEAAGTHALHFDLMDGRFCPDLTVGTWFVAGIETTLVKDVHLMVAEPTQWVGPCVEAGAGIVTVHLEAGRHVHRALELIGEAAQASGRPRPLRGLGLCPGTPPSALAPYFDVIDIVYVLGINPGWRQPMLPGTLARVAGVRQVLADCPNPVQVAVDGGVTLANFEQVAATGADLVVSGSAVFAGGQLEANLAHLTSRYSPAAP